MSGEQSSAQTAEQAEDQFLGQMAAQNGLLSALTPNDSASVTATIGNLISQATGGQGSK